MGPPIPHLLKRLRLVPLQVNIARGQRDQEREHLRIEYSFQLEGEEFFGVSWVRRLDWLLVRAD